MSPRRRLGVALLLDPPVAEEVDGLRRALGDESLDRVPPHLTLVPPVNVAEASFPAALEVLRRAAQAQRGPLVLTIGPVASFLPASPVLYLSVDGPGSGDLSRLHGEVLAGPLQRRLRWPWVPHVTLRDGLPEHLAGPLIEAFAAYRREVRFDRVVLLEELGHRWAPIADACFGPPAVVGRGGLPLELSEGRLLGPEMQRLLGEAEGCTAGHELSALSGNGPGAREPKSRIVIEARREGRVVGAAQATVPPPIGSPIEVCVFVVEAERGQGFGRALLAALEARAHQHGWHPGPARGIGPPSFFAHCGSWAKAEGAQ